MEQLPFVGMAKEMQRLRLAFAAGDPLVLLGPQGSGKTRLIREALSSNHHVLYVAWVPTLHALLTAMARVLIAARHSDFLRSAKPGADPDSELNLRSAAWRGPAQQLVLETAHEPKDRGEAAGIVADGVIESGPGEAEPPLQKHIPRFDRGDLLNCALARRLPGARVRNDV